jgi:hypothetical protein
MVLDINPRAVACQGLIENADIRDVSFMRHGGCWCTPTTSTYAAHYESGEQYEEYTLPDHTLSPSAADTGRLDA